jgi:hypothetical protein
MHGLINRSIQSFLRDSYGPAVWTAVLRKAEIPFDSFEPLLSYPPEMTDSLIASGVEILSRPRHELLEDMGTYLVSSDSLKALRRLLRFGGVSFVEFLHSLEDLPDRAHLALSDLSLPEIILLERGEGRYFLRCAPLIEGTGHIIVGLLRAMADDYGALVLLDHLGVEGPYEVVSVHLLDQSFSEGNKFDLALPVGRAE